MGNGKCSGLLWKRQWEFPNENDGSVHKNGERAVLKFAGEIAADPGIRAQKRQMTFAPTARDIGEHRQDRQCVIVVPKQERIVPEKKKAKRDDDPAG